MNHLQERKHPSVLHFYQISFNSTKNSVRKFSKTEKFRFLCLNGHRSQEWPNLFFVVYEPTKRRNSSVYFFPLTIISLPTCRDDNVKSHPIFQNTRRTKFHRKCRHQHVRPTMGGFKICDPKAVGLCPNKLYNNFLEVVQSRGKDQLWRCRFCRQESANSLSPTGMPH